jgi:hypothetical protein
MMFKVTAPNFVQEFERWVDALEIAKSLIPKCRGIFQEVRILENNELIWVFDRLHRHPQFMGAGTYKRLALRFLLETAEDEANHEPDKT